MWKETNKFKATFNGSERFYPQTKGKHFGQDFAWVTDNGNESLGKPIHALEGGKIVGVTKDPFSKTGKQVIIKTNEYFRSYQHLDSISNIALRGGEIKKGQLIGACGETGNVTGAHLHTDKYYRINKPKCIINYLHAKYGNIDVYYVNPKAKGNDLLGKYT